MNNNHRFISRTLCLIVAFLLETVFLPISAQETLSNELKSDTIKAQTEGEILQQRDSLSESVDSIVALLDSASLDELTAVDSLPKKAKRDWTTWRPNPKRAMWLAIVIPGAGQVYNRKFWKLPIVYGGFLGCIYALRWNGQMYNDYSQAYMDLMDNDPSTESYNKFLHLGATITDAN